MNNLIKNTICVHKIIGRLYFSIVIVYWPKILFENFLGRLELKQKSMYETRNH